MALLERIEKTVGIIRLRPDVHPAAKMVVMMEMRIVGGEGGEAPAFIQQLVEKIEAFAAVAFDRAAVIIDFDGMGDVDGTPVLDGELGPGRMSDADEGAGLSGAAREAHTGLFRRARCEIERQACGDDVPELSGRSFGWMKPATDDGGEAVGAQRPRIGNRPAIMTDEMVGKHHEVIARVLIGLDNLVGRKGAIGQGGMRVEIAAPETAGQGEGSENGHEGSGQLN